MKARPVPDLDGDATLGESVARILEVRVDELLSFVPRAFDRTQTTALHDLRIAAKRLRYVLELTGAACVGDDAGVALRLLKELQGVLGEIHDCDEIVEMLAGLDADDGVEVLSTRLRARREARFARFVVLWPAVRDAATSCSQEAARRGLGSAPAT